MSALRVIAVSCVCLIGVSCSRDIVKDADVLGLTVERAVGREDHDPIANWFRFLDEKEGVWRQSYMMQKPYADLAAVSDDCHAYMQRTGRGTWHEVTIAHHARLWLIRYRSPPAAPRAISFGGQVDLWYDSLKRKVVAETYVE